jgi:2,4'-dihydroxyacetophenone dioxygenase
MLPETVTHQDALLTIDSAATPTLRSTVEGISIQPFFFDVANGTWVIKVVAQPGTVLPRHFHTGPVHLWTLSGTWNYVEFPDQPQSGGHYLYEPGGSVHQFMVPADAKEPAVFLTFSFGANIDFHGDGAFQGIVDAGLFERAIRQIVDADGVEGCKFISAPIPEFAVVS